mmetsp:Transcript_2424/g.7104  ORF Transcript_2424/g.7104 Transcript_2424/m.7104 type:complete len:361 (+) Transcript_2424:834-1916(+)
MDTLSSGAACSRNQLAVACPASWCATVVRSVSDMTLVFFSRPPMTRSTAEWKCESSTASACCRAACSAASLHTLAMSAPEKPGVSAAMVFAVSAALTFSLILLRCWANTSRRPLMSGRSMRICRSKRPGRMSASSRMSARLVAARMMIPEVVLKPSISTSSWLSVFSRSSLPPAKPPLPRLRPTASISSIKTMHGAMARAWLKRSRTRAGPTPTNISMKSEPEMDRKGTEASPAVAFASIVLPVPGGPTRSAPFGTLAPSLAKRSVSLRKLTNSETSCFASSHPATSLKVTSGLVSALTTCGLALPTWKMLRAAPPMPPAPPPVAPPRPPDPRMSSSQRPMMAREGPILSSSPIQLDSVS